MLATKDKGILLQIVKRCNRIDDILSNVTKKDFDIVWDTSKDSVPQLNSYCKKVLSDN